LTGSDSECSEADERVSPDLARHGSVGICMHSGLLIVICKQEFRIVPKLHPQMQGGALVFYHFPLVAFPCIPFAIFLHSHPPPSFFPPVCCYLALCQQKITALVASIKQQVDLKSKNSFKDGFVVIL